MASNNIVPFDKFEREKSRKEFSKNVEELVSEEEIGMLVDSIYVGQDGIVEDVDIMTIVRWAEMTRLNNLMLKGVMEGLVFPYIDEDGTVCVKTIPGMEF